MNLEDRFNELLEKMQERTSIIKLDSFGWYDDNNHGIVETYLGFGDIDVQVNINKN